MTPDDLERRLRDALRPGRKAYRSIPHLPGSRTGPSDRTVDAHQTRLCTAQVRDSKDRVVVLEKLDGTCVAAVRLGDQVVAVGRYGRLAAESRFIGRQHFARWVGEHQARLRSLLEDGERVVGEWLSVAHGTRYALPHEPFVAFDLIRGERRALWPEVRVRAEAAGVVTAATLHEGAPCSVERALELLGPHGHHGAIDLAEGAVWRLERDDARRQGVDLVAKVVRQEKVAGLYLADRTGEGHVWNRWLGGVGVVAGRAAQGPCRIQSGAQY